MYVYVMYVMYVYVTCMLCVCYVCMCMLCMLCIAAHTHTHSPNSTVQSQLAQLLVEMKHIHTYVCEKDSQTHTHTEELSKLQQQYDTQQSEHKVCGCMCMLVYECMYVCV